MAMKLLSWGVSPSLSYSKDFTLTPRDKGTDGIGAHETVGKETCLRWESDTLVLPTDGL